MTLTLIRLLRMANSVDPDQTENDKIVQTLIRLLRASSVDPDQTIENGKECRPT